MSVGRLLKLIGRFEIGLMHSMRADRKKTGLCHWTFKEPSVVRSGRICSEYHILVTKPRGL